MEYERFYLTNKNTMIIVKTDMEVQIMNYKGYYIDNLFGFTTVEYNGDEIVFNSVEEAKKFIDEL